MLQPGETVVAATPFRDFVVVFGSQGTVIRMFWDEVKEQLFFSEYTRLDRR